MTALHSRLTPEEVLSVLLMHDKGIAATVIAKRFNPPRPVTTIRSTVHAWKDAPREITAIRVEHEARFTRRMLNMWHHGSLPDGKITPPDFKREIIAIRAMGGYQDFKPKLRVVAGK